MTVIRKNQELKEARWKDLYNTGLVFRYGKYATGAIVWQQANEELMRFRVNIEYRMRLRNLRNLLSRQATGYGVMRLWDQLRPMTIKFTPHTFFLYMYSYSLERIRLLLYLMHQCLGSQDR